jgi:hypothetical protein
MHASVIIRSHFIRPSIYAMAERPEAIAFG